MVHKSIQLIIMSDSFLFAPTPPPIFTQHSEKLGIKIITMNLVLSSIFQCFYISVLVSAMHWQKFPNWCNALVEFFQPVYMPHRHSRFTNFSGAKKGCQILLEHVMNDIPGSKRF